MSQTKTIKYASGLVLNRNYDNNSEQWIIDNKALSIAEFTIDISSCKNVSFEGDEGREKKTITIDPQETETINIVKTLPWSFSASFSLTERPMPYEDQKEMLEGKTEDWNKLIEETEEIFKSIPYEVLDTDEIVIRMAERGQENFIDPHFPPRNISLFNVVKDEYPFDFMVHWRRPHEFMKNPAVFEHEIDPNDIKQGGLGDCWFLSALSSLAERPGMVKRLFITQEYNKEGIYKIKICKNGEWVVVTVDDYIPCRYNGGPIFSRGAGNELWVMLIEKAYAKLHGNYHALSGGFTAHAMIDLSGCPTEHVKFPQDRSDYEAIEDESNEIFEKLLDADNEGYLISTETSGVDTITEGDGPGAGAGLVSGHAYSVIQIKEHDGIKLLNIRNPWGQFEWNGAWSDNSSDWTEEMKEAFEPVLDANDGSFWMSLEDFMMKFEAVNLCRIENFEEVRLRGKFIKAKSRKNNQELVLSKFVYTFEIEEENDITIGIHQEDERIVGAHLRKNMDAGFVIMTYDPEDLESSEVVEYCEFTRDRENFKRVTMEPGMYVLIPLTTGGMIQKSLDASEENVSPKFNFDGYVWPHPYYSSTINDIFRKIDLAVNGLLSAQELNQFGKIINEELFMKITSSDFTSDNFERISCNENGVSLLGLKQLLFRNFNNEEIMAILNKMGYDNAHNSLKSRAFMISIQANDPVDVQIKDILETDYANLSWDKVLEYEMNAEMEENEELNQYCRETDDYTVYVYPHPNAYACSYAFQNNGDTSLKVTIDITDSQSCLYMPSSGIGEKIVAPGEFKHICSLT